MKKLLAILLSALMLLSAFAAAEGGSVTLGNVQVSANGEMLLDLSGLELVLAAAESDAGLGLRLALNYGAGSADEAVVWLGGTELALKASFLSDAYFMDVGALAGEVEEASLRRLWRMWRVSFRRRTWRRRRPLWLRRRRSFRRA